LIWDLMLATGALPVRGGLGQGSRARRTGASATDNGNSAALSASNRSTRVDIR
jgi:hypothetical protein